MQPHPLFLGRFRALAKFTALDIFEDVAAHPMPSKILGNFEKRPSCSQMPSKDTIVIIP